MELERSLQYWKAVLCAEVVIFLARVCVCVCVMCAPSTTRSVCYSAVQLPKFTYQLSLLKRLRFSALCQVRLVDGSVPSEGRIEAVFAMQAPNGTYVQTSTTIWCGGGDFGFCVCVVSFCVSVEWGGGGAVCIWRGC